MTRRRDGQATIELLAMLPAFVLIGLLAWQLAAVIAAGLRAQDEVRSRALATPAAPGVTVMTATAPVPAVLPGLEGMRVRARIGVRAR